MTTPTQPPALPHNIAPTRFEYENLPGLSYSGMKELLRSPKHFQHWLKNPKPETKALRIGKAAHCAFLTPDLWATTYKAIPDCDRRTKEGKELHAAFMDSLKPGNTALAFDEYELATNVAQAGEAISRDIIQRDGAWIETALVGKDKNTLLKGIPDLIDADGWIYDFKTTEDASERTAIRTILNYGYHLQAAHYINLAHCNRNDIRGFRIVMVEKEAPFEGCIFEISGELLELGFKETQRAYALYDKCLGENTWPGYHSGIVKLDTLPGSKAGKVNAANGISF